MSLQIPRYTEVKDGEIHSLLVLPVIGFIGCDNPAIPNDTKIIKRRVSRSQDGTYRAIIKDVEYWVKPICIRHLNEFSLAIYVENPETFSTRGNPRGNGGERAKFGGKTRVVRVPEHWNQEMIDNLPDLFNLIQTWKEACKDSPTSPRYQRLKDMLSEAERLGY
jgi:hypothetical protein